MADGGSSAASVAMPTDTSTNQAGDEPVQEGKDFRVSYQFALGMIVMALVLQLDPGWWESGFPLQSRIKPGNPLISLLEFRRNRQVPERVQLQKVFLYEAHGVRVSAKIEDELKRLGWRDLPAIAVNTKGQPTLTEFGEEILADAYLRLRRPTAVTEGFRQKQIEWLASWFLDVFSTSLPRTVSLVLEMCPQLGSLSKPHEQEEFATELLQRIALMKLIEVGNAIEQLAPSLFTKSWEALLTFKQALDAGQDPLFVPRFWRELAFAIYRQCLKQPAPSPA